MGGEQKGTGVTQVKVGSGEDGGGKGETRVPPPPKTEGGGKGDGGRPQVKEGTWGPSRRNGGERRGRGSTATTDGGGKGDGGHPQAHRLTGGQGSTTEWGGPPKGRGGDKGDRGGHPQVTITEWGDTGGTRVDHRRGEGRGEGDKRDGGHPQVQRGTATTGGWKRKRGRWGQPLKGWTRVHHHHHGMVGDGDRGDGDHHLWGGTKKGTGPGVTLSPPQVKGEQGSTTGWGWVGGTKGGQGSRSGGGQRGRGHPQPRHR